MTEPDLREQVLAALREYDEAEHDMAVQPRRLQAPRNRVLGKARKVIKSVRLLLAHEPPVAPPNLEELLDEWRQAVATWEIAMSHGFHKTLPENVAALRMCEAGNALDRELCITTMRGAQSGSMAEAQPARPGFVLTTTTQPSGIGEWVNAAPQVSDARREELAQVFDRAEHAAFVYGGGHLPLTAADCAEIARLLRTGQPGPQLLPLDEEMLIAAISEWATTETRIWTEKMHVSEMVRLADAICARFGSIERAPQSSGDAGKEPT